MHLLAVAKSMLIALALVDWTSPRLRSRVPQGTLPEGPVARPREIHLTRRRLAVGAFGPSNPCRTAWVKAYPMPHRE